MKFFKCNKCGHVMLSVNEKSESITCCGVEARLLKAGEVDAALEKHVPAYNLDGDKLEVVIGEVIHPMEADHYIEFIAYEYAGGYEIVKLHTLHLLILKHYIHYLIHQKILIKL